jgi:hypothetical protein
MLAPTVMNAQKMAATSEAKCLFDVLVIGISFLRVALFRYGPVIFLRLYFEVSTKRAISV